MAAARKVSNSASTVAPTAPSSLRAGITTESFMLGSPPHGTYLPCVPLRKLLDHCRQVVLQFPGGEMRLEFGHIGDITDVVTDARVLLVSVLHREAHIRQQGHRFEDGEAILPATTEVIDLTTARGAEEVQKH